MKNRLNLFLGTCAVIAMTQAAHAASATWNGTTDAVWATPTNWSATPIPGTGDTATFSNAGGSVDTLNLGAGVTIGNITFDLSTVAAYTIGSGAVNSQTLTLNDNGAITANSTINANQIFNAALVLGTDATAQSYTITNNDTGNTLTFAGSISGGSTGTAGIKTLNVSTAGGLVTFGGVVGDGGATALALTKSGSGTLTLSGASTYSGGTTVNLGTLNLTGSLGNGATTVSGGTLNLTGSLGNSAMTVASGAFLSGEGSIGATGSLTLDGGSNLRVDGSTAGALTVGSGATGDLTLNSTTTVILDKVPAAMSAGTNTLRVLNYNGALTGSAADLDLFVSVSYRNPVLSTATPKQVNLSIDSKALTWSGATGAWDINTTANWNSGADNFYQGDAVTFDDSGTTKAVAITGTVQPTSVIFNNTTGATNDYTVSGIIGGATALSANGTGKVTLSGANTYTGTTTVGAGTLVLTNTNTTSAVSIASGAVLEISKEQALSSSSSVTLSGAGTLRITGSLVTTTGAGPQAINFGSGALIDIQAGTYNGGFGTNKNYTNNKADLNLATGTTFGTSNGTVRMDALSGLGTINASSGSFTGGSFAFGVDNGTGSFGGVLATTSANKFAFTKLGTGTQTLSGINTYTSTMNVNDGVLLMSGSGTLGAGTAPLAMGGGQLDLGGLSQTVGAVTVTKAAASGDTIRNGSLTGASYAASNTTGTAIISANLLVNATAGFAKTGAGTVTLSGTNTYTGTTSVGNSGGSLQIDSVAALPSGSTISLPKSGASTGTLKLNTSGTNSYANTFATFASSSGAAGGGTPNIQNLQGDNTISGNMTINATGGSGVNLQSDAGTLRIAGTLSNTVATSFRAFEFGGAGNGVFSGLANDTNATTGVSLVKTGAGTWSITGTNSNFTGGVSVLQGVLNVASVADSGTNSAIGAGGAINLTGQGTSGTLQYTGSAAVTTNHALNVAATGGTLDASGTGGGTLKLTGTVTATDPAVFALNYTNGSTVATNTTANLPGTVNGNLMSVTATGLAGGTTITSISGNSYTLSNPFIGTTGSVSTTFGANVARTLTLTGSNSGNNEISSSLANSVGGGVLSVSKSGSGTWVLSGTNTYTGATSVTLGTLALVGGSHTSPITVSSGATLGFTLGSPTTSTSTVAFSGATAKVSVSGTPVAATLMTASNITGTPVLDPAIPGFVLAVEGGGTLLNLKASTANYNTWASTNGVPGQAANLDHDNDGVSNGVEYFIGGPTGNTTGFTALPGVVTVGPTRSVTWVKNPGYTGSYGTDFVVETSTTLGAGSWTPEILDPNPGFTVTISGNNVTYIFPAGPVKTFARLKVTGP